MPERGLNRDLEIETDDPIGYVISANLHRRHLNESQRAMVGARIVERYAAQAKKRSGTRTDLGANLPPGFGKARDKAAAIVNVSPRSVQLAKDVLTRGSAELVHVVDRGELAVSAAARILDLPKAEQTAAARDGRRGVVAAVYELRERRNAEVARNNKPLGRGSYAVVLADPPWSYDFLPSESRATERHYPTMALEEIKALPVAGLAADDCVLFLWATAPKLAEALEVVAAWGFTYRTSAVWVKDKIGLGRYFRSQHEYVLVATRGEPPTPVPANRPPSVFEAPRTRHSQKPTVLHELVEKMYPSAPKIELFARCRREGWEAWGNEAPDVEDVR